MNTLILYASRYGATREIARRIAERMEGAVLRDLRRSDAPSVDGFDRVLIGSPLYAGRIRRVVKVFVNQHSGELRGKALGLFLSGLEPARKREYFRKNFPPEILKATKATCFPGGIYDPAKAGLLHKLMLKAAGRGKHAATYVNTIDDALIERFVEAMRL